MFTKQHYKAIADVLDQAGEHVAVDPTHREGWFAALSAVTVRLADLFAADSDRFKRELFMQACAISQPEPQGCAGCGTTDSGRFNHVSGVFCSDCWGERFECEQWPGVAVRIVRHPVELANVEEEDEQVQEDRVVVVMVGDDREHEVGADELTRLAADAYCHECGQTSCGHGRVEV